MLNRVVLIGRLTKDPELRYTPNAIAVTNFTLAVERNFKNAAGEKETDFFQCSVFKQLAELCANYLSKGKLASIDGRVQIRTYNDKDGKKQWVTEIIGENVQFLSPKDAEAPAQTTQTQQQNSQPPYNAPPTGSPMGAPPSYGQQPQYGQPPAQPGYPGQFTPPGYAPQQQGQWQAPGPGQQQQWQQPNPNMPNPNMPPQQGTPGALPSARFGHEVNLDDDIPF